MRCVTTIPRIKRSFTRFLSSILVSASSCYIFANLQMHRRTAVALVGVVVTMILMRVYTINYNAINNTLILCYAVNTRELIWDCQQFVIYIKTILSL